MKVIDLYNKITKGEEVPKKIKFRDLILEWDYEFQDYKFVNTENHFLYNGISSEALNIEIEIIEEPKEIEKLGYFNLCKDNEDNDLELTYTGVSDTFDDVYEKINELIDVVIELKKENK